MKNVIFALVICMAFAASSKAQSSSPTTSSVDNDTIVDSILTLTPESRGDRGHRPGPTPHPRPGSGPSHGGSHNGPLPPPHSGHEHAPIGHHPGPGWHDGGPRPGYHHGWNHDHNWRPRWWHLGISLPIFVWSPQSPRGYWQCTAFSTDREIFSASAPDREEAIYNALYDCGGANYEEYGCYIPEGYCQFRR